jgi:hypothetical protein
LKIYLIGSLKNPRIPWIGNSLRSLGHEVFDDWHAGGPTADVQWRRYHQARGDSYAEALKGKAGGNAFHFDMRHLAEADAAVLVLPAGKSAHMELGVMHGWGRHTFVLFEEEPEDWDLMYKIADEVFFSPDDLIAHFTWRMKP